MSLDFNGQHETKDTRRHFSKEDIQAQLDHLLSHLLVKHTQFRGVMTQWDKFKLNWSKRIIFLELEYQSSLQPKHNIDVIYIEKNIYGSLLGTLLMNDKSKDISNVRADMENLLNIQRPLRL